MRLILLPALGADERIFSFLGELPGESVFPNLPVPFPKESMETYASRLAGKLVVQDTDLIGGVSFGGMVAAEICPSTGCQRPGSHQQWPLFTRY